MPPAACHGQWMVREPAAPDKFCWRVASSNRPQWPPTVPSSALPGLVECFDHVDAEMLSPAALEYIGDDARLIGRRRQRALAHASGTRPADLADHDLLAGKIFDHALADRVDMAGGVLRRDRIVFPIGQDVNGDEIHCVRELAVAQPELPHVSVGHRHLDTRLHAADRFGQHGRRHFARSNTSLPTMIARTTSGNRFASATPVLI